MSEVLGQAIFDLVFLLSHLKLWCPRRLWIRKELPGRDTQLCAGWSALFNSADGVGLLGALGQELIRKSSPKFFSACLLGVHLLVNELFYVQTPEGATWQHELC